MQQIDEPTFSELLKITEHALSYFFKNTYVVLVSSIISFLGYLTPVKDIVHLTIGFFICDVIFGYWKAKVINKEKFSVKIIWGHTIPRMAISLVLITGAFLWDKVYEQDLVSTYKIIGWFISGVLLCSIADNGYKITKWRTFQRIGSMVNNKMNDLNKEENNDKQKTNL